MTPLPRAHAHAYAPITLRRRYRGMRMECLPVMLAAADVAPVCRSDPFLSRVCVRRFPCAESMRVSGRPGTGTSALVSDWCTRLPSPIASNAPFLAVAGLYEGTALRRARAARPDVFHSQAGGLGARESAAVRHGRLPTRGVFQHDGIHGSLLFHPQVCCALVPEETLEQGRCRAVSLWHCPLPVLAHLTKGG